jgi:biotin synthase-like enzyme
MVGSMRGPGERDIEHLAEACGRIAARYPALELCLSMGLLSLEQAALRADAS